tara:strand:- start:3907 stop:4287 length:381 start_codon:yes stop_codon:yes gene_type:complete
MARVTNEALREDIDLLKEQIRDLTLKLPNGEIAVLQSQLEDVKTDLKSLIEKQESFLTNLYNPTNGLVYTVTKNTDYIDVLKKHSTIETILAVDRFRANYSKLMWGLYALLGGSIFGEKLLEWMSG